MIILGIDPGTATTGYGVIETKLGDTQKFVIKDYGVISTKKSDNDAVRLFDIATDLEALIKKYKPKRVGIERLFFTTNQKTAMTVSQARGVILVTCQKNKIPIFEFTPLEVKNRICGYGKADKKQVQYMIKKTFGLTSVPKPDDAADALAIALCTALQKTLE